MIYNVGDETHIELSDEALRAVEHLIRLNNFYLSEPLSVELANFANVIRAHLQHQVALPGCSSPATDDWLSE